MERDELVSAFPDVHIDVRPLGQVEVATLNLNISPGSLYMQSPTFRYRIVSDEDGLGNIGTHADGTDWDGTLRFVWDDDSRRYKTLSEVSVTLYDVREDSLAAGVEQVPIYDTALDQNPGGGHAHQLTVTFGILETTKAFDGFCWLGNLQNEEAINYATRVSGLALAPRIPVEVIGVQAHIGPFTWIGMPAYRVPVGGTYAPPTSDILQEKLGDGTATDPLGQVRRVRASRHAADLRRLPALPVEAAGGGAPARRREQRANPKQTGRRSLQPGGAG